MCDQFILYLLWRWDFGIKGRLLNRIYLVKNKIDYILVLIHSWRCPQFFVFIVSVDFSWWYQVSSLVSRLEIYFDYHRQLFGWASYSSQSWQEGWGKRLWPRADPGELFNHGGECPFFSPHDTPCRHFFYYYILLVEIPSPRKMNIFWVCSCPERISWKKSEETFRAPIAGVPRLFFCI